MLTGEFPDRVSIRRDNRLFGSHAKWLLRKVRPRSCLPWMVVLTAVPTLPTAGSDEGSADPRCGIRAWTQKQTGALRSDDARRATLILEDQVGRLTGFSGFPFATDLHKDPVTAGPRSYIRNKAHCWGRAVVHRRGRQRGHSTGASRASSSLRRSNAICSPALFDRAFWLRCSISSSWVMSSAASTAMRS